jgi:hypothetical protein
MGPGTGGLWESSWELMLGVLDHVVSKNPSYLVRPRDSDLGSADVSLVVADNEVGAHRRMGRFVGGLLGAAGERGFRMFRRNPRMALTKRT